ncbi:transglycosylase SLT domain-containing protein [Pedobacter sp. HMF7647]|uniref:Transglycosylase SLT domain-containing protein n=1 Tax=Hufsiella arboris TaxID=2695275 RepID=A0A7K1YBI3_9SPHI|nr:lytic transglycosylase domain-containing protein [Hufsiella arboris]MXV51790.1 transglycosylase SLT domain-containing protein [Hufsiella arboris]
MIKKHLLACSVMLVLTVLIKASIYQVKPVQTVSKKTSQNEQTLATEVKAEAPKSRLNFANEDLPVGDPKVNYKVYKALKNHSYEKIQTTKLHRKAMQWFPVIEPILRIYGIPEDFKYIPLVESGLQAGTSPKGASGYWQFMPGTARNYGLRVNSAVDERQDMRKSTVAACKYLNEMYKSLKSWTLVAAAYNLGDVKLLRQINRQNQDNYFKLKLNRETGSYIYNLVSMKQIIENPSKYGFVEKPKLLAYKNAKKSDFKDPIVERIGLQLYNPQVN